MTRERTPKRWALAGMIGLTGLGGACAKTGATEASAPGAPEALTPAAQPATAGGLASAAPIVPAASAATRAAGPESGRAAADRALVALLGRDERGPSEPLPRALFTWTTEEQTRALRRTKKLLVRSTSPTKGPDFFQRVLSVHARGGNVIADALLDPRFRKARFAWPAAWATVRGFPGESYGDRLVRVVLDPNALVVEHVRSTGTFRILDLSGRPQPDTAITSRTSQIAAVVFVNDLPAGAKGAADGLETPSTYREIVLVNEAMIETWEIGTEAVRDEIARGRALAEQVLARASEEGDAPPVARWLGSLPAAFGGAKPDPSDWRAHYAAALALGSPHYRPAPDELRALVAALAAAPADEPALVHKVTQTFTPGPLHGGLLPPPPPPPPTRRRFPGGTF